MFLRKDFHISLSCSTHVTIYASENSDATNQKIQRQQHVGKEDSRVTLYNTEWNTFSFFPHRTLLLNSVDACQKSSILRMCLFRWKTIPQSSLKISNKCGLSILQGQSCCWSGNQHRLHLRHTSLYQLLPLGFSEGFMGQSTVWLKYRRTQEAANQHPSFMFLHYIHLTIKFGLAFQPLVSVL